MAKQSTTTRKRAASTNGKGGSKPSARAANGKGGKGGGSAAARKAWETRRANGWQHPKKARFRTPAEVAKESGLPLAKVRKVLALAAERVPVSQG